ncbi:hypothetical protein Trydic_g11029 [Trypoxylus dichotomus]
MSPWKVSSAGLLCFLLRSGRAFPWMDGDSPLCIPGLRSLEGCLETAVDYPGIPWLVPSPCPLYPLATPVRRHRARSAIIVIVLPLLCYLLEHTL